MDSDEILLAALVGLIPCVLVDHGVYAILEWQRKRAGIVDPSGFGAFGRTVISLGANAITCLLIAYVYRLIGRGEQDAYLIAASIWLMVSIPVLFTSRYIDDAQQRLLATRVLAWLFKTAIAATAAALIVTLTP
ncbi:MAG: hypothetical protein AB1428_05895 [Bacteroidota bacterium]